MHRLLIICFNFALVSAVHSSTLHVPAQYSDIQSAITASVDGDTILVADGTYTGTGNRNISFQGKNIVLMSENGSDDTIIDCESLGAGFIIGQFEDSTLVIDGFTVTNAASGQGAGIYIWYSHPLVKNCRFLQNTANGAQAFGGAIYLHISLAKFEDCEIIGNSAVSSNVEAFGGGIHIYNSTCIFQNCLIADNLAQGQWAYGGGVYTRLSTPDFIDCEISGNSVEGTLFRRGAGMYLYESAPDLISCEIAYNFIDQPDYQGLGAGIFSRQSNSYIERSVIHHNSIDGYNAEGAGVFCHSNPAPTIVNCTIANNSVSGYSGVGAGVYLFFADTDFLNTIIFGNSGAAGLHYSGSSTIQYCNIAGNEGGSFSGTVPSALGNISRINANGDSCDVYNNLYLDPGLASPYYGIYHLQPGSVCIDAGDPSSPTDPDGSIVDIGRYYYDLVLYPPVVQGLDISIEGDNILLNWSELPNADSYNIYSSDVPYFDITGMTPIVNVNNNTYIDLSALSDASIFYIVTLVTE